jgi:hypothetical protein
VAEPEPNSMEAMPTTGGRFGPFFGRKPQLSEKSERTSPGSPVHDPEAEALNSLFTVYEKLAGAGDKLVTFDEVDRSLRSSGWRDIESEALADRFAQASAFSRLARGDDLNRLGSTPANLDRERQAELAELTESQYSGPLLTRFYSNEAIQGASLRFVCNKVGNALLYTCQFDAILKYSAHKRVLAFCKADRIARHFVDYSRCTWKVDELWPSRSQTIAGRKYYGGRDTMDTWFVANLLSEEFRNSDRWHAMKLPEIFMSISRRESHP